MLKIYDTQLKSHSLANKAIKTSLYNNRITVSFTKAFMIYNKPASEQSELLAPSKEDAKEEQVKEARTI